MKKIIIVVIGVIVIIGAGFALAANKTKKNDTTSTSTTPSTSTSSSSTTPTATTTVIIKTANGAAVGQYLTDGSGKALYTYGADTSGKSNCTGSCLYNWPVYAPGSTTNLPTNVTIIKRDDGSSQYAYKGMPLYYFSSDSSGQATGDGVGNFHLAKP